MDSITTYKKDSEPSSELMPLRPSMFKIKASESWVGNPEQMMTSNKALNELHGLLPGVGS